MSDRDCICEFDDECDGSGAIQCTTCGGDFCICAECGGHGEVDCEGCENCVGFEDLEEDDQVDASTEDGGPYT